MSSTRACPSLSILHRLYKTRAPRPRLWHSRSWLACFAAAALTLAGGLMGCGTTTRFAPLNPAPHQLRPKLAAEVEVYSTGLPARPYSEIGLIQGTQSSEYSFDDMPEIIAEMRAAAGRIGCDALVLNGPNSRSTAGLGNLPGENSINLQGFWGTCIAYLPTHTEAPPPPVVLAPPPPEHDASERPSAGPIARPTPERPAPIVRPAPEREAPSTASTSSAPTDSASASTP